MLIQSIIFCIKRNVNLSRICLFYVGKVNNELSCLIETKNGKVFDVERFGLKWKPLEKMDLIEKITII